MSAPPLRRHRTLWISDLHLGTPGCKAELLLDFLKHNDCDTLYLVGDIIDGWVLKRRWYWPQAHNDVVQKILRKSRKGTRVIYVPGNHDEGARQFIGLTLGNIPIVNEAVHTMKDGRRLLVLHGDKYDGVMRTAPWLAHLGDHAYRVALVLNRFYNLARARLGYDYWSLSAYLKHKVKKAVQFIDEFELNLVREARRRGMDGVVCGHIHKAEMRVVDDVLYCNDGDWVESCTALAENADGRLSIVEWTTTRGGATAEPMEVPA